MSIVGLANMASSTPTGAMKKNSSNSFEQFKQAARERQERERNLKAEQDR